VLLHGVDRGRRLKGMGLLAYSNKIPRMPQFTGIGGVQCGAFDGHKKARRSGRKGGREGGWKIFGWGAQSGVVRVDQHLHGKWIN
jgi:hypothetical protein